MSGIYNANICMGYDDDMRNVVGIMVAATLRLKNFGYTDEAVYTILPMLMGVDVIPDPGKTDDLDKIMDSMHKPDDSEDAEIFIQNLKDTLISLRRRRGSAPS